MTRQDRLFDKIRNLRSLRKAWLKIYENGRHSESDETQKLVSAYKQSEEDNLKRLAKKLRVREFEFGPARGVAAKKKSGKPRPIVSASIEARIVQRAILDELSRRREIKKYFSVKTSFGAIPEKGVPEAIKEVVNAIQKGANYYIKSDIADFFANIPRPNVIEKISNFWNDIDFSKLLEKSTNIEVNNLNELAKRYGVEFRDKFIFNKTGTPQGCCLSPLIGNVLLYEFDLRMNTDDVSCIRYLDDFIILGPTNKAVCGVYRKAKKLLNFYNLTVYDLDNKNKTSYGMVDKGFEFLGVEIRGKLNRPSSASRTKFLESIRKMLGEILESNDSKERTLVNALYAISNKIRGWGNQYKFCNDSSIKGSIDEEIAQLIIPFFFKFSKSLANKDKDMQRKLIGIWSLADCKNDPILFQ